MDELNLVKDIAFMKEREVSSFSFDKSVADCFSDMAARSIPSYSDINRFTCYLASKEITKGENIYDVGCSNGTTLLTLLSNISAKQLKYNTYIGIDSSSPMINNARTRLPSEAIDLFCDSIMNIELDNARVIFLNYVLQFLDVKHRDYVLNRIYRSLNKGGVLFISEKIKPSRAETEFYHEFKRMNGYSDEEILNKSLALKNVLIEDELDQLCMRLKRSGFNTYHIWNRQYNFVSIIARKL